MSTASAVLLFNLVLTGRLGAGVGEGSAEVVVEERGLPAVEDPGKGTRLPSQFMSWGSVSELVRRMNYCRKKHKTTDLVVSSALQEGCLRRAWHDLTFWKI